MSHFYYDKKDVRVDIFGSDYFMLVDLFISRMHHHEILLLWNINRSKYTNIMICDFRDKAKGKQRWYSVNMYLLVLLHVWKQPTCRRQETSTFQSDLY